MTSAAELRSGKTYRDENFPVASWVIHPRHRKLILAFYNFVRTADDIADHASLSDDEKLARLDSLDNELIGTGAGQPEALNLRKALAERAMSPRHARDVITAFRMDVTKKRYENWDELIHYCAYSAMPVGRFMLDVHGESVTTWPASDALCAALQIINHLQDCGDDYRNLDRVYIPRDLMEAKGASVEMLALDRASPQMIACIRELADKTGRLLEQSHALGPQVRDRRLALEIAVIQSFAARILALLKTRDPLSETVHLSKLQMAGSAMAALAGGVVRRATTATSLIRPARDA